MKSCCSCSCSILTAKTGSLIIGAFGILVFVFAALPQCAVLDEVTFKKLTNQEHGTFQNIREESTVRPTALDTFAKSLWITFVSVPDCLSRQIHLVFFDVIYLVASALLITGVAINKRVLLVPWLLLYLLTIVSTIAGLILLLIWMSTFIPVTGLLITAAVGALFVFILAFLWFVVYFTFQEIKREVRHQRDNPQNQEFVLLMNSAELQSPRPEENSSLMSP